MAEQVNDGGAWGGLLDFKNLPVWARLFITVVLTAGPTAAIAMFLVFQTPRRMEAIEVQIAKASDLLRLHDENSRQAVSEIRSFMGMHQMDAQQMVRLLRQVCVNGAKDAEARRECLR